MWGPLPGRPRVPLMDHGGGVCSSQIQGADQSSAFALAASDRRCDTTRCWLPDTSP